MSRILKYFKQSQEVVITPKAKEMAAKEVNKVAVEDAAARAAKAGMKRRHYDFFLSDDNKAKVAKYGLEHGVASSLQLLKSFQP